MIPYTALPHLNAILNGLSALVASAGFISIRKKKWRLHRAWMLAAVALSAAFLTSYLIYHAQQGSIRLQRQGWIRPVYFTILISHSALALAVVPLVIMSLVKALSGKFGQHKRIARWAFPIWIYVSITGVIVYLVLYW